MSSTLLHSILSHNQQKTLRGFSTTARNAPTAITLDDVFKYNSDFDTQASQYRISESQRAIIALKKNLALEQLSAQGFSHTAFMTYKGTLNGILNSL